MKLASQTSKAHKQGTQVFYQIAPSAYTNRVGGLKSYNKFNIKQLSIVTILNEGILFKICNREGKWACKTRNEDH